jgi:hypothetical protein
MAIMTARAPGVASLAELQPLTGLNLFWPNLQGPIAVLLAAVNPFDAWFVVALAAGLRRRPAHGHLRILRSARLGLLYCPAGRARRAAITLTAPWT